MDDSHTPYAAVRQRRRGPRLRDTRFDWPCLSLRYLVSRAVTNRVGEHSERTVALFCRGQRLTLPPPAFPRTLPRRAPLRSSPLLQSRRLHPRLCGFAGASLWFVRSYRLPCVVLWLTRPRAVLDVGHICYLFPTLSDQRASGTTWVRSMPSIPRSDTPDRTPHKALSRHGTSVIRVLSLVQEAVDNARTELDRGWA